MFVFLFFLSAFWNFFSIFAAVKVILAGYIHCIVYVKDNSRTGNKHGFSKISAINSTYSAKIEEERA